MSDRPIIFNGPMVRAILAGRKTQTRRVLKPQPDNSLPIGGADFVVLPNEPGRWCWLNGFDGSIISPFSVPYRPGDRLWVKEAHRFGPYPHMIYRADDKSASYKWRSAKLMRRWASRLTLIVEDVRVQRVQEISADDAVSEGAFFDRWATGIYPEHDRGVEADDRALVRQFRGLWNEINAKRGFGWDANPWVVALTFRAIKKNIDEVKDDE